tara:strand:+ start:6475 stop:6729 length:255 start_codon:yes stop_codon:yes gene_type:complete
VFIEIIILFYIYMPSLIVGGNDKRRQAQRRQAQRRQSQRRQSQRRQSQRRQAQRRQSRSTTRRRMSRRYRGGDEMTSAAAGIDA